MWLYPGSYICMQILNKSYCRRGDTKRDSTVVSWGQSTLFLFTPAVTVLFSGHFMVGDHEIMAKLSYSHFSTHEQACYHWKCFPCFPQIWPEPRKIKWENKIVTQRDTKLITGALKGRLRQICSLLTAAWRERISEIKLGSWTADLDQFQILEIWALASHQEGGLDCFQLGNGGSFCQTIKHRDLVS